MLGQQYMSSRGSAFEMIWLVDIVADGGGGLGTVSSLRESTGETGSFSADRKIRRFACSITSSAPIRVNVHSLSGSMTEACSASHVEG